MSNTNKRGANRTRLAPSTEVDGCPPKSRLKPTADKPSSDGVDYQTLASANGRRPLIRVGPGLVLAVLASIAVWAFMPRQPSGPKISPSPASMPAISSAPDPHWLLRQADALGLTPVQAFKLSRLVNRWDRDTAGLKRDLDAAAADLRRRMPSRPEAKLSVQKMQQDAGPMAALSGQMADARRAWWAEARTVLTPSQRAKAEAAWSDQWSGRGTAKEESR